MFGLMVVTRKGMQELLDEVRIEEYNRAVADVISILKDKEHIFLDTVFFGAHSEVKNSVFLGGRQN